MKLTFKIFILILGLICLRSNPCLCNLKSAKYAGEFMAVGVGARALAMGGAYAAVAEDITAIYWNPAGLSSMQSMQIHGMHAERFAGVINWDFLGIGFFIQDSLALGLGFCRLGVAGIPLTRLTDPSRPLDADNVPQINRYVNDNEMVFMLSFGKKQTHFFSIGGSVKIIRKSMTEWGAWGIGFDFGILYNPVQKLKIGAVLVDGTSTLIAWSTGRQELLIPHLRIGATYPFQFSSIKICPSFDMDLDLESRGNAAQIYFGRFGIDLHGGGEISFKDLVCLRAGSDRGRFTVGGGFHIKYLQVDYGFLNHFDLGHTHRISLTLFINTPIP